VIVALGDRDYDIHYWEGVDSTADETGSAAALTVELSENLKKASRHHLELMHEETGLFLSYFKSGIEYLHGGVGTGFKHVVPEFIEPRLLQVKGRKFPRVFPAPVVASSLNEGDCFVLDLGVNIYIWTGADANQFEKVAALNFAINVKNHERKAKSVLNYPQDMGGEVEETFWKALGGKPASISPAKGDEEVKEEGDRMSYRLWHLTDATGSIKVD
jgi:hypothetical protein